MSKRTFQTIQLADYNWQVFCLETQEAVTVCVSKERAVKLVAQLNARASKAA